MIECKDAMSLFCTDNPEKCGANEMGQNGVLAEYLAEYKDYRFGCVDIQTANENNKEKMDGILDIKNDNFLGGLNVHHVIIITLLLFIAYKVGALKGLAKAAKSA